MKGARGMRSQTFIYFQKMITICLNLYLVLCVCTMYSENFVLQVGDLAYASPATVSRAGMVYVDPKNLGYQPYWQRWVQSSRHPNERELLEKLYMQFVPNAIEFVCEGVDGSNQEDPLKTVIVQTNLNMITQLCHMFDAMLPLHTRTPDTAELALTDVDAQNSAGAAAAAQEDDMEVNEDVILATFLMVNF